MPDSLHFATTLRKAMERLRQVVSNIRNYRPVFIWLCYAFWIGLQTIPAQTTAKAALLAALRGTPAIGIVIDVKTGQPLAASGNVNNRSTPGSLLKPLFLAGALEQNVITPQTTTFCRRNFHIQQGSRDWNLTCTHPQTNVAFNAREALAYSCNRYFAGLADRITPAQAAAILAHYGIASPLSQTREQKELLVLGLSGVTVSPKQIAIAFRRLALHGNVGVVREGLADSVIYGMAHNAAVRGMDIEGKTGTASDPGESWSHGWFAGTGLAGARQVVLVVYLDHGNGADAARLAQHFFSPATTSTATAK
jgi:membrane peptidoglycan carboxypeptidase